MRILIAALALVTLAAPALSEAQQPFVPSFWDPDLRLERPDLTGLRVIRFLTADDYPPLNFALPDGSLAGFNVEIARAICEELSVACTIQARRFDTLIDALVDGKGDAVIASLAASPAARARVDFSSPYYQTPARFVSRKGKAPAEASVTLLKGKTIGVVAGSAHQAYLKTFFPLSTAKPYPDLPALEAALRSGETEAAFGDGLTLAVWLNGEDSHDCCAFFGGPFGESRFFGEGVSVAVRRDDPQLRRAIDWALAHLAERGVYGELYLKYFPVGFY